MAQEKIKDKVSIEESFKQLEELIVKMEDGQTGLEELFGMYKEGCELLRQCNETIDKVEKEIEQLQ